MICHYTDTYDANGNQLTKTADGNTETNTYDGLNQLISFADGTSAASYTYNHEGIRTSKTVDGETIYHIWDGGQIVNDVNEDLYSAENYIRGTGLVASQSFDAGVKSAETYYIQNAHGDVVNLADSTGSVTKTYKYDAFGVEKNIVESDTNPFRYCGEYFDKETGTIYLRARYYDPSNGRFISRDSFAGNANDPLSLNLYTYCHNNPILYRDPSGHNIFKKWYNFWYNSGGTTYSYKESLIEEKGHPIKAFKSMTKSGDADWLLDTVLSAGKDDKDVYHIRQKCKQEPFGYNDFYDWAFDKGTRATGTTMDAQKYDFNVGDETYILWAWKGDYINLGAGAELGLYKRVSMFGKQTEQWASQPELAMPMTLNLKYKNGGNIFSYKPSEPQWWINGFNPQNQDNQAADLTMTATVDFSGNKDLWGSFSSKYNNRYDHPEWDFTGAPYTAKLTW